MKAHALMTGRLFTTTPNTTIAAAANAMRAHRVGMLPVVRDVATMTLVGVITDRDIATRCAADGHHTTECRVGEHMTTEEIATVDPNDELEAILHRMESRQLRRIPVVEANGRVVGVVAQADLATKVGPMWPQVIEAVLQEVSRR